MSLHFKLGDRSSQPFPRDGSATAASRGHDPAGPATLLGSAAVAFVTHRSRRPHRPRRPRRMNAQDLRHSLESTTSSYQDRSPGETAARLPVVTVDHESSAQVSFPGARVVPTAAGKFSCVIDSHPRFHLDALRWFSSLTRLAGVDAADLVVHAVGPARTDVLTYLA